MPTRAQEAPVVEIQRCAKGCANWLRELGYVNEEDSVDLDEDDIVSRVDVRVNATVLASTVFGIYTWLWMDVLPVIDGRREAERQRIAARSPAPGLPNPVAQAELYLSNEEHKFADRVREINASIQYLSSDVERIAKRQKARALLKNQNDGTQLLRAYVLWVRLGGQIRNLVEPSLPARGGAVPHTMREWQEARVVLEAQLHEARMSDPDISRVLPGGGEADDVYQRRYRARRR